jgi:hypothetical protein
LVVSWFDVAILYIDLERPVAAAGPQTDNAAITEAEKRVGGASSKKDD